MVSVLHSSLPAQAVVKQGMIPKSASVAFIPEAEEQASRLLSGSLATTSISLVEEDADYLTWRVRLRMDAQTASPSAVLQCQQAELVPLSCCRKSIPVY